MQYHAESLLTLGWHVEFVGYRGSKPLTSLVEAEKSGRLRFHYLATPKDLSRRSPLQFLLIAGLRSISQMFSLLCILVVRCRSAKAVLCQTPPAMPVLAVVHFARCLTRSRLLLDWHNTSSSILAGKRGETSHIVKMMQIYERTMARIPARHLVVSEALQELLSKGWKANGPIQVLRDRPHARFKLLSEEEAERFLTSVGLATAGEPSGRSLRLVSSTSWTEDEDFGVLLEALRTYDRMADADASLAHLSIFISGKGPLLDSFVEKLAASKFRHSIVRTLWLEPQDYPRLLGSCDAGFSLHRSKWRLDLPMKIADMFGAGLPVIALGYPALRELVRDGCNGLIIETSEDLAAAIARLQSGTLRDDMRTHVLNEYGRNRKRWEDEWRNTVLPLLS